MGAGCIPSAGVEGGSSPGQGGCSSGLRKCSVGGSGNSDGKESACSVGDPGLIPGSGRSPREGNGNPLQYSFFVCFCFIF